MRLEFVVVYCHVVLLNVKMHPATDERGVTWHPQSLRQPRARRQGVASLIRAFDTAGTMMQGVIFRTDIQEHLPDNTIPLEQQPF
jgi:hypothetical protein